MTQKQRKEDSLSLIDYYLLNSPEEDMTVFKVAVGALLTNHPVISMFDNVIFTVFCLLFFQILAHILAEPPVLSIVFD